MNDSPLESLATNFKADLNKLFYSCFRIKPFEFGDAKDEEKQSIVAKKVRFSTKKEISIAADFICLLDREEKYLSVESSNIHVFGRAARQPLFRFEYMKNTKTRSVPNAHLQIHGESGAISMLKASDEAFQLSDIHFPVGGGLMRPSIEEILLMCDKEFSLEFSNRSVSILRSSLKGYREKQALAIARNYKDVLESKGWIAPK